LGVLFKIFGCAQIVGQLANVVLGVGSLFLVLSISRLLFFNEIIARISIALLTLYPNNAAYAPLLMTETFFTFLVLLGTYLFLRSTKWICISLSGLIFGLAALTKPQVIFLPGVLILLQFLLPECPISRVGRALRATILYAMIAIANNPLDGTKHPVFGEFVLISTNGGATLLTGNNPSARGDFTPNDPLLG
jgi:Gpi18-like mannosyltransferase